MRSIRLSKGALLSALVLAAGPASANQFVGDLVYCEVGGERGVYEPELGDYGLDAVTVNVHCTDAAGTTCDVATTTGAFHASVDPAAFQSTCASYATFDLLDPAARTGRYAVNLLRPESCGTAIVAPLHCTVSVDPNTLPADCDALVSPTIAPELPADGNGDGDWCDAEDGPFVEGQILGDNGADQAACEAAPSIPGDGAHEYNSARPPAASRCSLYEDFAFEGDEPECVPCIPRTHQCGKSKSSWRTESAHPGIPYCPSGVKERGHRHFKHKNESVNASWTTSPAPEVVYCPVDDSPDGDHPKSHHRRDHEKHWKKGSWGWGWN